MEIRATRGNVIVEVIASERHAGKIQLLGKHANSYHTGRVVSVGNEKDDLVPRCSPGDTIVFQLPDYMLEARQYATDAGQVVLIMKIDDVLGTLHGSEFKSTNFKPVGPWIFLRRDRTTENDMGLILPEKYRAVTQHICLGWGQHVALDLQVDQALHVRLDRVTTLSFEDNASDYAFIHYDNVLGYVTD